MAFEQWALVEIMGHTRIAGWVTEENIADIGFLRVDVPAVGGREALTRYIGPKSIHSITPVTESVARMMAEELDTAPVSQWSVPEDWREKWARELPKAIEQVEDGQECPCPCADADADTDDNPIDEFNF